jgi:hypothetical protein
MKNLSHSSLSAAFSRSPNPSSIVTVSIVLQRSAGVCPNIPTIDEKNENIKRGAGQ